MFTFPKLQHHASHFTVLTRNKEQCVSLPCLHPTLGLNTVLGSGRVRDQVGRSGQGRCGVSETGRVRWRETDKEARKRVSEWMGERSGGMVKGEKEGESLR